MSRELDINRDYIFENLFEIKDEIQGMKVEVENDDDLFPDDYDED